MLKAFYTVSFSLRSKCSQAQRHQAQRHSFGMCHHYVSSTKFQTNSETNTRHIQFINKLLKINVWWSSLCFVIVTDIVSNCAK